MKLTVGSLPSAVYWRRRAMVLGGVLIVVLLFYAACSGASGSGKTQKTAATNSSGAPDASASMPSPTVEGTPSTAAQTEPPATTPPATSGTCTDEEIALTPEPASATATRGQRITMRLKVKNISTRSCSRDLGADAQELYLLDSAATKMWSSDACGALHGTSVRTLAPGAEQVFHREWDGKTTSDGCSAQKLPAAGRYQLIARLGPKTSAPVTFTIN